MKTYPPTPELDRIKAVSEESQSIGVFIDWLNENEMQICEWTEWEDAPAAFHPTMMTIEKLLVFSQVFRD